jgi:hypothetical protein
MWPSRGLLPGLTLYVNLASFEECVAVCASLSNVDGVELLERRASPFGVADSAGRIQKATYGTLLGQGKRDRRSRGRHFSLTPGDF